MSTFVKALVVILILVGLGVGGYFGWQYYQAIQSQNKTVKPTSGAQKPVSIPTDILNNKFGYLSGGGDDYKFLEEVGAGWVRPHPGAFLWDAMQKDKTGGLNFKGADAEVKKYGDQNIAILGTMWSFAEWDQVDRADAANCAVSENDEFLAVNDKKGRGDYLPSHRCVPIDWASYNIWVKAVVERYDGDGISDMPGLKIPVKYWEIMNEPDLPVVEGGRLVFWKDTPSKYAELLVKTAAAIKEVDPEAKVVIAGAAGGNDQFLSFYRVVLAQAGVKDAFDIANIHCISNDSFDSFNVEPYKKLLAEFGLNKPIWVTEAEAMISADPNINATQTKMSTKKAIELGVSKIFYTRYDFETRNDLGDKPQSSVVNLVADMDGKDPVKAYRAIFESLAK